MQATITKKLYRLSVDCVLDLQGQVWQARDVAQDVSGELDLMLDTTPYEARLYCYSSDTGWDAYNAKGVQIPLTDSNILEYLAEVRQAILPIRF